MYTDHNSLVQASAKAGAPRVPNHRVFPQGAVTTVECDMSYRASHICVMSSIIPAGYIAQDTVIRQSHTSATFLGKVKAVIIARNAC